MTDIIKTQLAKKWGTLYVNVAIKSYAISSLTGSTFDGFIDCANTTIKLYKGKKFLIFTRIGSKLDVEILNKFAIYPRGSSSLKMTKNDL